MTIAERIRNFIRELKGGAVNSNADSSKNAKKIDIISTPHQTQPYELLKFNSKCNVFRRHYICIDESINGLVEMEDRPFCKFAPPAGMTKEEVLLVMSYLSKRVERELKINPKSFNGVKAQVEMLKTYHFKELGNSSIHACIDLFTLKGRYKNLLNTTYYKEYYFDWYNDDVTTSQIQEIYKRLKLSIPENICIYDIVSKSK